MAAGRAVFDDQIWIDLPPATEEPMCSFRRMREVNPELVIENCASGGHRLEPFMMY